MSDLRQKLADLDALCEQAAKAKQRASFADHNRKVILAKQMILAEAKGANSAAIQERNARASDEYQAALIELAEAEAEAFRASGLYYNRRDMLSAWQTIQANERAQLKHLGGVS